MQHAPNVQMQITPADAPVGPDGDEDEIDEPDKRVTSKAADLSVAHGAEFYDGAEWSINNAEALR